MKEITFVCPTSKLTRTIKVCETQKEFIGLIHRRRILKDGSIFVLYENGDYFFQVLGTSGYKTGQFKRYGISSATVSSYSGELFVFGDFAVTPDGCVCIGEEDIKKYGSYSGQYDVQPEKVETKTETKAKTIINMEHFDDEYGYELIMWYWGGDVLWLNQQKKLPNQ